MPPRTLNRLLLSNHQELILVRAHVSRVMTCSAHTKVATPGATRELLRHLGWLMEEVVRGSQEKVGLAQAVYDSVRDKVSVLARSLISMPAHLKGRQTHPSPRPIHPRTGDVRFFWPSTRHSPLPSS